MGNKKIYYYFLLSLCIFVAPLCAMEEQPESALDPKSIEEKLRVMKEHTLATTTTESQISTNLRLFFSNTQNLQHNCVTFSSYATHDQAKKAIAEVRAKNKPMIWWVTSHTSPSTMGKLLQEHGFTRFPLAAIACSLKHRQFPPINLESTMHIAKMDTNDKEWKNILQKAFNRTDDSESEQNNSCVENYGLYYNNELVSVGSVFVTDDWVGICNAATKESMRRKGFAKTLGAFILHDLQRRGFKTAVSMAVPASEIMGKKFGFEKVFDLDLYYIK